MPFRQGTPLSLGASISSSRSKGVTEGTFLSFILYGTGIQGLSWQKIFSKYRNTYTYIKRQFGSILNCRNSARIMSTQLVQRGFVHFSRSRMSIDGSHINPDTGSGVCSGRIPEDMTCRIVMLGFPGVGKTGQKI